MLRAGQGGSFGENLHPKKQQPRLEPGLLVNSAIGEKA